MMVPTSPLSVFPRLAPEGVPQAPGTPLDPTAAAAYPDSDTPEEVPADESFGDILTAYESGHAGDGGQTLQGNVLAVAGELVFIDIGRKHEGILFVELGRPHPEPGETVEVTVTGRDDSGYYQLSMKKVEVPKDWSGLEAAFASGAAITGTVEEVIKGGLRVDVGVRAFLPASRSGARDVAEMEKLVGQQIECRITKLDTAKEDVVVDRRVLLEEQNAKAREEAFAAIREGAVVTGTVRNVQEFGAFVDLGGVDGLLHVTEMSWNRGVKPQDVVKPGDQVQVVVLKIQPNSRKISLGMKQLQPDPWTVATGGLAVGQRIRGKVMRTTDFGAFVELTPGVEGLIHVSEMSWSRKQKRPSDIVTVGEMVDVVVLGVNAGEKRIALGLKQTLGDPWEAAQAKYPVGTVVEAPVTNLADFGAFVDLGDGVEGMIHVGDITREKRLQHPKEVLTAGQTVKAKVTDLDQQRRRIRLSIKELEPTSADHYIAEHKVGDVVTGRVADVHRDRAKVELAEGVTGLCRLAAASDAGGSEKKSGGGAVDVGALSAMLAARWKSGPAGGGGGGKDTLRTGQVRQFKISALDPEHKRIDLEMA